MNQTRFSNGAFGESARSARAAKPGEFTIHPSSIDVVIPVDYQAFPKMLYTGSGLLADEQCIVLGEAEMERKLAEGWRTTPQVPVLSAPMAEHVAAKRAKSAA